MFVHFVATTPNCDRQRIYSVARYLEELYPDIRCFVDYKRYDLQSVQDDKKVVIFQRVAFTDDSVVRKFKTAGYKVVVEMDDDPRHFDIHIRTQFLTYRLVDAVIVSTPTLREFIKMFNRNTYLFENCLDWIPAYREKSESPIRLFFGAFNRQKEYQGLLKPLNFLLKKYGAEMEVTWDKGFYDQIRTPNKRFIGEANHSVYMSLLANSHIALLPLRKTAFNQCKSDLKFIEAASVGTVALASPTVYQRTIKHEETGIIYQDEDEFEYYLERLIVDSQYRSEIAKNAYQYVSLGRHLKNNIGAYKSILERLSN